MPALAADEMAEVRIALISQPVELPPDRSNLDLPPDNEAVAGAELAIVDNNTTGRFMKQHFVLDPVTLSPKDDVIAQFSKMLDDGHQLFVLDVPAAALLEMSSMVEGQDVMLFNVGAPDDRLRGEDCRPNVLHMLPSRAMKADALAQYLVRKRWREWLLVIGRRESDRLLAEAVRKAARKFGAEIVEERTWDYGADARRTAQAEVPAFTQGIDYDVLVVADEIEEFGWYLEYATWNPRPIAGSAGLVPTTWHRTHEKWGSAQLQSRFRKRFGRSMTALDYQAWMPIRSIGEAATRTRQTDLTAIHDYIFSDKFELAGFKGQKLTFRKWNGQLRQPILLVTPKALVSVSPQDGFLHQTSNLDTMGFDEPETECRFPG